LGVPHVSQMGHHVPQPLASSPATSISCVPVSPPSRNRPKLQLRTEINNTQPRTFGKGSSLRLDTLTTSSPTIRNTYSNAYERQANSTSQSGLRLDVSTPKDDLASESQSSAVSSATTTSSTLSLESDTCPYLHPSHLKSVLRNSHYPKIPIRRMSVRPMFPLRKSVSFKEPLQEDIHTTRYTLAHSDIDHIIPDASTDSSSQSTETSDSISTPSDSDSSIIENGNSQPSTPAVQPVPSEVELQMPSAPSSLPSERDMARQLLSHQSRTTTTSSNPCPRKKGHKRDSSESGSDSDDSAPQTPIASRSKRHRWAWTLGPLPGYQTADCDEIEVPMGSREGSVNGDDLPTLSPGALLSPAE